MIVLAEYLLSRRKFLTLPYIISMPTTPPQNTAASQPPELLSAKRLEWDQSSEVIRAEVGENVPGAPLGSPCQACGAPREGSSRFCASCGAPLATPETDILVHGTSGSNESALPSHILQCKGCGAEVATSLDQRSYVCPFCDTSVVVEIPLSAGRQRPEFVIGFAVTAEQAKEKFWQWLKQNSWYRPGDLAQQAISDKQRGVYLPFWHFSMYADSDWAAQIGQYWYRTETYTTTDANGKKHTHTRQVRETEWFPLQGEHHRYYFGFMFPATRGINLEESRAIQPFQMSSLARYRPHYLAGWMAEEYSIDREVAAEKTMEEFRKRQHQEIAYFLPGDTHSNLQVQTQIQVNGSDLVLLPVHVLSYRYKDKLYRFLVNGQTGKIVGQKPVSGKRITALVFAIILVIALIILTIAFLAR
jgi:hypothetical protein